MDKLNDKLCNRCELSTTCKNICQSGIGAESEGGLMIVAEMPSWYDEENDTVLGSPPARIVERIIQEVIGGDLSIVYKTHLVKCKTPESRKPSDEEISKCRIYLEDEIKRIKPKVIVALGDVVYNSLCSSNNKFAMNRGKITPAVIGKGEAAQRINILGTFSPYYVDKVQSKLEVFVMDLMKAYNYAKGITVSRGTEIIECTTIDLVKQAVAYCKQVGVCSFDFETDEIDEDTGTFAEGFRATSLSLSFQAGSAYVIPLEHFESPYTKQDCYSIVQYVGKELFSNRNVRKLGHNINYDMHIARIYGVTNFRGRLDDSMLMHHLYDETKRHSLKNLVTEYYPEYSGYEDEISSWKWAEVPWNYLCVYNGTDTDMTLRLCTLLESYLLEDERVYRVYRNLTMAAVRPLWRAEVGGMLVDADYLASAIEEVDGYIENQQKALMAHPTFKRYELAKSESASYTAITELKTRLEAIVSKRLNKAEELTKKADDPKTTAKRRDTLVKQIVALKKGEEKTTTEVKLEEKIRDLKTGNVSAYSGFNFGSWQQLEDLFYDSEFGFRFLTFTRGTGKGILEELPDKSGFIEELLLLRTLEKMQGTYLKGLWKRMDKNKRVHTQLKLAGTVSGRLASANPNLQNIPNLAKLTNPIAIKVVGMIKRCFKCPEGYTQLQGDYSQAELKIIAAFAMEETMLTAYEADKDLHALTASNMMEMSLEDFYLQDAKVQKAGRTKAKAGNFGLIYGMGWKGFMAYAKSNYKVELSETEAKTFRDNFFKLYSNLLSYHDKQAAKAKKYGWVRTMYGRKRHTPEINSNDDYKRSEEERVAINSPVQGTAGEFTIFAITLLSLRLDPRIELAITVHDSIQYYVPDELLDYAIPMIKNTAEHLPNQQYFLKELPRVGMKVDLEASKQSWKDLQELDKFYENQK